MSKTAKETVLLNKVQIILGVVGIALVLWTLYYTRRAAWAAAEAAIAAVNQAKHAERAIETSQNTAKRQLRAYVSLKRTRIWPPVAGQTFPAEVVITNFGQTPAYNVKAWMCFAIFSRDEYSDPSSFTRPPDEYLANITNRGVVGPSNSFTLRIASNEALTRQQVAALTDGTDNYLIFIWGEIVYVDTFGVEHFTRFREQTGAVAFRVGATMSSRQGHEAN